MIETLEDLKNRYGYKITEYCSNCRNCVTIDNVFDLRCGLSRDNRVKVVSTGMCSAYKRYIKS